MDTDQKAPETLPARTPEVLPPLPEALPIVRPGMTLWAMLDVLERMETGLLELTAEEMRTLGAALRMKVDGYKQFLDFVPQVAKVVDGWVAEMLEVKSTLNAKTERLKGHMKNLMLEHGFEKLPGYNWEARLQNNGGKQAVTLAEGVSKPDSDLYRRFPDFIRRTYAWDMDAVAKALEAGDESLKEYAKLEPRGKHVRFGVNKQGVN